MKRLIMAVMSASAAVALAMPTKDELSKTQPLVAELMCDLPDRAGAGGGGEGGQGRPSSARQEAQG